MMIRWLLLLLILPLISVGQGALLVGNAAALPNQCYQLTQNASGSSGAVWFNDSLDLTSAFVVDFDMQFGQSDIGADGVAIVMKTSTAPLLGSIGEGLGYSGIPNSFAAEFDVFQNLSLGDPTFDHVGFHTNGSTNHNATTSYSSPASALFSPGNIENGNFYNVRIHWDPSQNRIQLYFNCFLRLDTVIDLSNVLFNGSIKAQLGVTAATGGLFAAYQFCVNSVEQLGQHDTISFCTPSIDVDYTLDNIETYAWSPTTGVSNSISGNVTLSPDVPTTYTILRTDSCGFGRYDTLTVLPFGLFDPFPPANIQCSGDSLFYDFSNYPQVQWSDGSTAASRYLSNPATYYVTVTSDSGCVGIDSLHLYEADLGLSANPPQICFGDSAEITANPPFAVFSADFTNGLPAGWSSTDTMTYQLQKMAGPYRNATVGWNIPSLPEHDSIFISLTLYVFDTWDGNSTSAGPDLWGMNVDGVNQINTTFRNVPGQQQSYPGNYLIDYPFNTGAHLTNQPARCISNGVSSVYQLNFALPHSDCDVLIEWYGNLQNAGSNLLCDESWGIDDIEVRTNAVTTTPLCPPLFSWTNGGPGYSFFASPLDTTTYIYSATFGDLTCIDSVRVDLLSTPFDPFLDSAFLCWDQQLTLNAGSGYASYLWSTGDTTQSIVVSTQGLVWVEANNQLGCLGRDSLWVWQTPEPIFSSDTVLCSLDTLFFSLTQYTDPAYQITWSDGTTGPVFQQYISQSDTIWVEIATPNLVCYDSLYIQAAEFELFEDTTIWCANSVLFYSAPPGAQSYLWSTGDTTAQTTFLNEGYYYVTMTAGSCVFQDTVWHEWFQAYDDIVPDSSFDCSPYALDLSILPWTSMNVEPGGLTGPYIILDQNGTYFLSGTDLNGCPVADTMYLWIGTTPQVDLFIDEFCPNVLMSYTINDTTGISGWSFNGVELPANTLDTVIRDNNPVEMAAWLLNFCGNDSVFVTYDPGCFPTGTLYLPTAFSPNGDNVNDYFRPQGDEIVSFTYQIYNRWGEQVYQADETDIGWDGSVNGVPVSNTSTFLVKVRVQFTNGLIKEETGTFQLIR